MELLLLLAVAGGAGLLSHRLLRSRRRARRIIEEARSWPVATARITNVQIVPFEPGVSFIPQVEYAFDVDGLTHSGRTPGALIRGTKPLMGSWEWVGVQARSFSPGATLTVQYDPTDPDRNSPVPRIDRR